MQGFLDGARPLPGVAKSVLLTGFRPGLGARASSVPGTLPQDGDIDETMYRFYDKSLYREYQAIAMGVMTGGGTVDAPMGRHPVDRKRQAVVAHGGKPAVTHYRVLDRYRAHTRVQVRLETGRTHQIRVHLAHRRYPLVGDPLYGGRLKQPAGATEALREALRGFRRQALHAFKLGLVHPASGEYMEFEAPLPEDFQTLVQVLEADREAQ